MNEQMYVVSYFVDTADPETERSTLDTGAVHVITNEQNQLDWDEQKATLWK